MSIDEFEKMTGVNVFTRRQRSASEFLQTRGSRFLYEHGFENCERMAEARGWEYVPLPFEIPSFQLHAGWRRR